MAQLPPNWEAAVQRWGYLADAEARKYGLPNGATLLAKIGYIESRWTTDPNIESYAGAKGWMQFIPSTRAAYVQRYGVDPWESLDEAVHAAALFMKHTGLAGYNPGSSTYINEVLGAPAKVSAQGAGRRSSNVRQSAIAGGGGGGKPNVQGGRRFLVTIALVLGGAAVIWIGMTRAVGSSAADAARAQRGEA